MANKGSSGCGIFTEDGKYIGMYARIYTEGLSFMIPLREIKNWALRDNYLWLFDGSPIPKEILDKISK